MEFRKILEEVLDQKLNEVLAKISSSYGARIEHLQVENELLAEEFQRLQQQLPVPVGQDSAQGLADKMALTPIDGKPALEESEEQDCQRFDPELYAMTDCTAAPPQQGDSDAQVYDGLYEVTLAFRTLCSRNEASISVPAIIQIMIAQSVITREESQLASERFKVAILALNSELCIMSSSHPSEVAEEIRLDAFLVIMMHQERLYIMDEVALQTLSELRDLLVREEASRSIAKATHVATASLNAASFRHKANRMEKALQYLDPVIGLVIMLNAIVIFISTDVQWNAWTWIEVGFTSIFMAELFFKLLAQGPTGFFTGPDMRWNLLDCAVILVASLDVFFLLIGNLADMRDLTLIRLLRFARLTKLARVLRLRAFKELTLLVHGILAGLRVLIWSIIFLCFILCILGVMLTRMIGQEDPAVWEPLCDGVPQGAYEERACNSAQHLQNHHKELFGNTPRSMFTVFRCLTDGCSSVDGTPLVPYFYNVYGTPVVTIYMILILFVIFGLFNLIAATFVQNTLENAKRTEAKRHEARHQEHVRLAQKLQELIVVLLTGEQQFASVGSQRHWSWRGVRKVLTRALTTRNVIGSAHEREEEEAAAVGTMLQGKHLALQVTPHAFDKMLETRQVQELLDELDIEPQSRHSLFEILDSNCNGTVEVAELVQGLVKLRGMDSKGDNVSSLLAIRAMQKGIKALEVLTLHQQQVIQGMAARQQRMQMILEGGKQLPARGGARRESIGARLSTPLASAVPVGLPVSV